MSLVITYYIDFNPSIDLLLYITDNFDYDPGQSFP